MKMTVLDRLLLFLTGILAAWQVAVGINGAETLPLIAYTVAFGVLLVAGLLLIILGFDVLDSPIVVIVSTIIPLSLSLGLVWENIIPLRMPFFLFVVVGFLSVLFTRLLQFQNKIPIIVLALVHGIAGLTIFLLPVVWSLTGRSDPLFALVGLGGALIGLGGMLLSFLKIGHPILSRSVILRLLPLLLFLMTVSFVIGFRFS
jgi:hypothetical protein